MIDYIYDELNRLTEANYSTGNYYHYTYDSVGNRLQQDTSAGGQLITDTYAYDIANRLRSVNGVTYTWDGNGNLLDDGTNSYAYDAANRLTSFSGPALSASFGYNGLGDRMQQTVDGLPVNYALDLNAGLTQVLEDGTYSYVYGLDRLAQTSAADEYFLGDALGSVRQLADGSAVVSLARVYEPYGSLAGEAGSASSIYGFTGEAQDSYIKLIDLRSRMYDPATGRFLTKDSWQGDYDRPMSYNAWLYVDANPINKKDPSGHCGHWGWNDPPGGLFSRDQCDQLEKTYTEAVTGYSYDGLPEMQAWYRRLADRIRQDGYHQSATNLTHFLDGSGSELQLAGEFMQNDIWGWQYVQNNAKSLADWYIRANVGSCQPALPLAVGPDIYTMPVVVGPATFFSPPSYDEYGSLASFHLYATLSGSLTQPWLVLTGAYTEAALNIKVTVYDYYNWHPGKNVNYPPPLGAQIPDDWADLLEHNGSGRAYGRSYLVRGDLDIAYTKSFFLAWPADLAFPPGDWRKVNAIGEGYK